MKAIWIFFLLLTSLSAMAEEPMDNASQEARAVALGAGLRCVVCQSESINDSEADMARDMRVLIREKISEGWSDQRIRDFARLRYGDFILLNPPVQSNTYLLWSLPLIFFIAATLMIKTLFLKREKIPN